MAFIIAAASALCGCCQESPRKPHRASTASTTDSRASDATTDTAAFPLADTATATGDSSASAFAPRNADCYAYLVEMVRSSNFPGLSAADRARANLVIDREADGCIYAQVRVLTDGSGVAGWVEYRTATRQLYNVTINSDSPVRLTFDARFAQGFDECRAAAHAPSANGWEGTYMLNFKTGEWVTNASGAEVEYTIDVRVDIWKDSARYEEVHTKHDYKRWRCRTIAAGDTLTLHAVYDEHREEPAPPEAVCRITRRAGRWYFTPLEGGFSYIEPLPAEGLPLSKGRR